MRRAATFLVGLVGCLAGMTSMTPSRAGPPLQRVNVFAVDGKDPRVPENQTGAGQAFAPIGIATTNQPVTVDVMDPRKFGVTSSTAFLISPCYGIATYHGIFGAFQQPPTDLDRSNHAGYFGRTTGALDHSITVEFGVRRGGGFTHKTRATPLAFGKYWMGRDADYAVFKMDDCLGVEPDVGWLDLSTDTRDRAFSQRLHVAGFYGELGFASQQLMQSKACGFRGQTPTDSRLFLTDCPASHGSSGAPIYAIRASRLQVVAVIIAPYQNDISGLLEDFSLDRANTAIDIAAVMAEVPGLAKGIAADIRLHGISNPSQARPLREPD